MILAFYVKGHYREGKLSQNWKNRNHINHLLQNLLNLKLLVNKQYSSTTQHRCTSHSFSNANTLIKTPYITHISHTHII